MKRVQKERNRTSANEKEEKEEEDKNEENEKRKERKDVFIWVNQQRYHHLEFSY